MTVPLCYSCGRPIVSAHYKVTDPVTRTEVWKCETCDCLYALGLIDFGGWPPSPVPPPLFDPDGLALRCPWPGCPFLWELRTTATRTADEVPKGRVVYYSHFRVEHGALTYTVAVNPDTTRVNVGFSFRAGDAPVGAPDG